VRTTTLPRRAAAITAGLSLALGAASMAWAEPQNHQDRDRQPIASGELEVTDDGAVLV
jgi:hypothetical protein